MSVFADRKDSAYGGRRDVAFTAVLDESAVPTDGASYQSSASGAPARQEPATVDSESSDSSSSSDDGDLPFYRCLECTSIVQGGGGILECSTCRGNRAYYPGDSVALLGLRTPPITKPE